MSNLITITLTLEQLRELTAKRDPVNMDKAPGIPYKSMDQKGAGNMAITRAQNATPRQRNGVILEVKDTGFLLFRGPWTTPAFVSTLNLIDLVSLDARIEDALVHLDRAKE